MKKTLIAMATLSTIITAQAGAIYSGVTSSSKVIEDGGAILVDNRTRIKVYPEIKVSDSLRGSGINVVESGNPNNTVTQEVTTIETVTTERIEQVVQSPNSEQEFVKRSGEITTETAKEGYTAAKTEKVYTKTFLGIPYAPINVVVEPAKPIFFGHMYYNNLTCSNGYNNGKIELYSHDTTSIIPVVFCPNDKEAKIELKIQTLSEDSNKAVILLGGQKISVEKGYTSIYNLRYDDHNVVNMEFIYVQDEHPVRY